MRIEKKITLPFSHTFYVPPIVGGVRATMKGGKAYSFDHTFIIKDISLEGITKDTVFGKPRVTVHSANFTLTGLEFAAKEFLLTDKVTVKYWDTRAIALTIQAAECNARKSVTIQCSVNFSILDGADVASEDINDVIPHPNTKAISNSKINNNPVINTPTKYAFLKEYYLEGN